VVPSPLDGGDPGPHVSSEVKKRQKLVGKKGGNHRKENQKRATIGVDWTEGRVQRNRSSHIRQYTNETVGGGGGGGGGGFFCFGSFTR